MRPGSAATGRCSRPCVAGGERPPQTLLPFLVFFPVLALPLLAGESNAGTFGPATQAPPPLASNSSQTAGLQDLARKTQIRAPEGLPATTNTMAMAELDHSSQGFFWWGIPLLALSFVNIGATFCLFRFTRSGLNASRQRWEAVSEAVGQIQTAVRASGWQAASSEAEEVLNQTRQQAAEAQRKLMDCLVEVQTETQNLAAVLERQSDRPQQETFAKQSAEPLIAPGPVREPIEQMKEKSPARIGNQERDQALERALWPAAFRNGGALVPWRQSIVDGVARGDLLSANLLLAIFKFEVLCHQPEPDLSQIGGALHELSLHAHRFWRALPGDFDDIAIRWRDEFNALISRRSLPLEVQAVHPQDRFDTNRMVCAEGSSGSRLYVSEPLSWIVLDKSNPAAPRVLRHGVVLTV